MTDMLKRIIDVTLAYRWFVVLGMLCCSQSEGMRLHASRRGLSDLTNNQVTVVTEAPSMPPTEVEQLVTYPIEQAMMGMPKQQEVRSLSELGLSMITIVFDDSVSMYFARQLVNERLQQITSQLPDGIQPVLGLPATAFGELYQYTLSGPMGAMAAEGPAGVADQAATQNGTGVSEVNTWGGEVKQYQITVDPAVLAQYGLTFERRCPASGREQHKFWRWLYRAQRRTVHLARDWAGRRAQKTWATLFCSPMQEPLFFCGTWPDSDRSSARHGAVLRTVKPFPAWSSC